MVQNHDSAQEVQPHKGPSVGMTLSDPQDLTNQPSANNNSRSTIFISNHLYTDMLKVT